MPEDEPRTDETRPVQAQGELTTREAQLAQGLAIIRAGGSYAQAMEESTIDRAVLCRAMHRIYCDKGQREAALEASDRRVEAQTATVVELAGDQVIEKLAAGESVPKDLAVIYGIGSDKYMRMRGLDQNRDRAGASFDYVLDRLATLQLEAEVTIRPAQGKPQGRDSIDIG